MLAAHPNPTRAGLTVEFTLPAEAASGSLALYDLTGRLVRSLHAGPLAAGPHRIAWDGRALGGERPGAGIYFLRLEAAERTEVVKTVVIH